MNESFETHLVGRFRIAVPSSFARRGQESRVHGIEVNELSFPSARPDEEFARFWQETVAKIAGPRADGKKSEIVADRQVKPGIRLVEYLLKREASDLTRWYLEGAVIDGNFGAHLRTELLKISPGHAHYTELTRSNDRTRRNLEGLLGRYRTISPRPTTEEETGFFLPHGRFAASFQESIGDIDGAEFVSTTFEDKQRQMRLSFKASFPFQTESGRPSMLESLGASLLRWRVKAKVLRAEKRPVAGFAGEELIAQDEEADNLQYTWLRRPGREPRGFDPRIEIEMETEPKDEGVATGLWDHVLASVKALPSP